MEILKHMHGRRNSWVASYPGYMALGTRLTPGLPRNIFCDATTDFMNECIAKADWNSMYKGSKGCRVHWVCRARVGCEVHRFWTSSWGEVPWVLWQTFQPQSQSLVFLSLELEITVVALLTTLTCDQLTQFARTLIICHADFSQLERGSSSSVWQCSSRDHEATGVDRKCRGWYSFIHIPWKSYNFFILLFDIIWLAPSWLSHFNQLGDLKQNSAPDSRDDQTGTGPIFMRAMNNFTRTN